MKNNCHKFNLTSHTVSLQRPILGIGCFIIFSAVLFGCSVRYQDADGHDTLIGFPPVLNEVETAEGSSQQVTWRRLRRTGIGLNINKNTFGLLIGYEQEFILWIQGDGIWEVSYSGDEGMIIKEMASFSGK